MPVVEDGLLEEVNIVKVGRQSKHFCWLHITLYRLRYHLHKWVHHIQRFRIKTGITLLVKFSVAVELEWLFDILKEPLNIEDNGWVLDCWCRNNDWRRRCMWNFSIVLKIFSGAWTETVLLVALWLCSPGHQDKQNISNDTNDCRIMKYK